MSFVGRHFSEATIVKDLSLVATKMSHEKVVGKMVEEGVIVHASTGFRWVCHYSQIMCNYSGSLHVDADCMWHVDELCFKILKMERYLFAVMDRSSWFVLSFEISSLKQGVDPTGLFSRAADRTHRFSRILVSDGLLDFCQVAKKVFYRVKGPRFMHIREIHLQNMFQPKQYLRAPQRDIQREIKVYTGVKVRRQWNHTFDDHKL